MKKTLLLTLLTFMMIKVTNAQSQYQFSVDIMNPVSNSTVIQGVPFELKYVIQNVGTDSIVPTDYIAYYNYLDVTPNPFIGGAKHRYLAPNDTMQISKMITLNESIGIHTLCVLTYLHVPDSTSGIPNLLMIKPGFDSTGSEKCIQIEISYPTSLNASITENEKLNISPNPSSGNNIHINYLSNTSENINTTIFDYTGRIVLENIMEYKNNFDLDISNLVNGVYILQINQNGKIATKKLLKN